jgi:hypothetical protein
MPLVVEAPPVLVRFPLPVAVVIPMLVTELVETVGESTEVVKLV